MSDNPILISSFRMSAHESACLILEVLRNSTNERANPIIKSFPKGIFHQRAVLPLHAGHENSSRYELILECSLSKIFPLNVKLSGS